MYIAKLNIQYQYIFLIKAKSCKYKKNMDDVYNKKQNSGILIFPIKNHSNWLYFAYKKKINKI